jgi:trans-aconitate 2-methyltransferase
MTRIDLADARRVVDLGCGTGNVTRIKERWSDADVIGIDRPMLMTARDNGAVRYLRPMPLAGRKAAAR